MFAVIRRYNTHENSAHKIEQRVREGFVPLISRVTKHPEAQIARSWEHHAFPLGVPSDLLDIVTDEEKWVAASQKREPRTRAEIERFIDPSVLAEARKRQ